MNCCGECKYWSQFDAPEGLGACQFNSLLGSGENDGMVLVSADPKRRLNGLRLLIGDGYGCVHWKKAEGPFIVKQGALGYWSIYLTFGNGPEAYVTVFAKDRRMTAEKLCVRLNQLWKIERGCTCS